MVRLYKAQILPFMESSTPALYHAAPSTLAWIDRVQVRFLKEIDLSEFDALRDFRLAPLKCRRDIAMLGVLHKVNLGTAPPQLAALFPRIGLVDELPEKCRLRLWRQLHNMQLATPVDLAASDFLRRSVFGLMRFYNKLPQIMVNAKTVKLLQRELQLGFLRYAELSVNECKTVYSAGWKVLQRTQFDSAIPA